MKQKKLAAFAVVLLMACGSNESTETKTEAATSPSSMNMKGYEPSYSANFEMGANANTETVLSLYRAWDDNKIDDVLNEFSDSVFLYPWNDAPLIGAKDSIMTLMKQYRGNFTALKTQMSAILSVKEPKKNEDWVLVWFNEVRTDNTGKTDSSYMQETWGLDKNGKVRTLYQYGQKSP